MRALCTAMATAYPMAVSADGLSCHVFTLLHFIQDAIEEYAAMHPIARFSVWFLTWAQHILRQCRHRQHQLQQQEQTQKRSREERDASEAHAANVDVYAVAATTALDSTYRAAKRVIQQQLNEKNNPHDGGDDDVYEVIDTAGESCVEDGVTPSLEQATATPAPEPRSIRHTTTSPFEQEEHEQQQRTRLLSASQRWIMGHTTGEDASSAIPRHLRLPYLTAAGSTAAVNLARIHLVQATEMCSWDLGGASKAVPSVDVWGSDHEYEEVQQQRTTATSLSVASTSSTASSSAKRSRKGSSSSGSIADPDDDNDEEEEVGGGVGVLWSMEVHKQVWRFFTPSQLA
jgi:hypothetical protein